MARFLDFSLLLLLAGGSGALLWALASAPGQVRRRLGTLLVAAAVGLAVVALAGIVFEGGVAGGFGLGDSLRWSVFHGVLETRFGKVWLAQAVMAAVFAVLTLFVRQRGDRWAAMGAGISMLRPRLQALVVSAFFTAIAGSLYSQPSPGSKTSSDAQRSPAHPRAWQGA